MRKNAETQKNANTDVTVAALIFEIATTAGLLLSRHFLASEVQRYGNTELPKQCVADSLNECATQILKHGITE